LIKDEIKLLPNNETKKNLLEGITLIEQQTEYISKIVADLQDYANKLCPEIKTCVLKAIIDESLSLVKFPKHPSNN